jgi:dTDP-4-amino-4,6-dideoxygalactose transaminase
MKVPLAKPYFDDCELNRVRKVLESGCTAGTCPEVKEYEDRFAETVHADFGVACSSGTAALHVALLSLGVGPGDEVIVPDFTFPATGFAPVYCGARPVLADVDRQTFAIDPNDVIKKITEHTKAIIPVYPFGMPPDCDAIHEIAIDHGLYTIGDAACALGSKYCNTPAGSMFDVECFSTYAIKVISTGEGGMITTNEEKIAEKASSLVDFGKTHPIASFDKLGFNYRLSAIQAAIGICQLGKLEKFIMDREQSVMYYSRIMEDIDWLKMQYKPPECRSSLQRLVFVNKSSTPASEIIAQLRSMDVEAAIGTYSLCRQPYFKDYGACPISSNLFDETISLPLYYEMTSDEIDYVVSCLKTIKMD